MDFGSMMNYVSRRMPSMKPAVEYVYAGQRATREPKSPIMDAKDVRKCSNGKRVVRTHTN